MTTHHCPACGCDTGVEMRQPREKWTAEQLDLVRRLRRVMTQEKLGEYFGISQFALRDVLIRHFWQDNEP